MDKSPQLCDSTIGPYSIRLKRVMYCCFKQSSSSRCVRSHASLFTKWLLLSNTTAHTTSFTRPGKCARYARCMVSSPGQGGQTPRHLPLHHPPMLYFLLPVDPTGQKHQQFCGSTQKTRSSLNFGATLDDML